MKRITLKHLKIENFKGVKKMDIHFDDNQVYISGANGTGKTTIFDAFTWLLFDKDSQYRTDFDIKPLDKFNNTIRVESIVEGEFDIDGKMILLKKTYKEIWRKKRGDTVESFDSNETLYEIDNVPVKKNDYKKEIKDRFTDEELFKLLTNPLYFSTQIKWKDARELILKISGDITNEEVINSYKELEPLRSKLEDKTIDNLLKSVKASADKLKKELKDVPVRISELEKSIVEVDKESIEKQISEKENEIKLLTDKMNGLSSNTELINLENEKINKLKEQLRELINIASERAFNKKNELRAISSEKTSRLMELRNRKSEKDNLKKNAETELKKLIEDKKRLEDEFTSTYVSMPNIDSIEKNCPLCGKPIDDYENTKNQYIEKFNLNKANKLNEITEEGKKTNKLIEAKELEISKISDEVVEIFKQVNEAYEESEKAKKELDELSIDPIYLDDEENTINDIKSKIEDHMNKFYELQNDGNASDRKEYTSSIKVLSDEVKALTRSLGQLEVNDNTRNRIKELETNEKDMAVKVAESEKMLMLCETFITKRVKLLENNINKYFKGVNFKLFNQQVNGGISETCEALIDGVPFSNANTASKINAGLSIIDTISNYYEIKLPIFIDNRESVILLEDVDTQIINLRADSIEGLQIAGGSIND